MARVELAKPAKNIEFWPANKLGAWRDNPQLSFLVWLANQRVVGDRQFRESSRETYAAIFSWWLSVLSAKKLSLLEATGQDATDAFAASGLEPVSRRRYLQLLDRVYRYLIEIGWTGRNPIIVELRKERELDIALPPGLDERQIAQVIEAVRAIPEWRGARDRCAAALLIGAGLRVGELINLRTSDVNEHYDIEIKQHSIHREHKTLILPEGPWREWFNAWMVQRREFGIKGEVLCPGTLGGRPYSPCGVFRRVNAWLEPLKAELPQTGPNLLRNTFARQALTCGRYEVPEVQEFLGHAELRATCRHVAAIGAIVI